jgi:hypothetical protein
MSGPGDAEDGRATELALREQINDLVRARARAESEAARLDVRGRIAGAEPGLAEIASRYRVQATRLAEEVESLRGSLRAHELEMERRRADESGA